MLKHLKPFIPKKGILALYPGQFNLGESPVWHPQFDKFFLVDGYGNKFSSLDTVTKELNDYPIDNDHPSSLAPAKDGFVASFSSGGFGKITLTPSFTFSYFFNQPCKQTNPDLVRFNDGKCDPKGRFIAGTMNLERKKENSNFYTLDSSTKEPRILVPEVAITNGPTWSLDGKTFFYVDSKFPPIYKADYDLETGTISNRTTFMEYHEDVGGHFDGAAIDKDGF